DESGIELATKVSVECEIREPESDGLARGRLRLHRQHDFADARFQQKHRAPARANHGHGVSDLQRVTDEIDAGWKVDGAFRLQRCRQRSLDRARIVSDAVTNRAEVPDIRDTSERRWLA